MAFYRRYVVPRLVNPAMRNTRLVPYRERAVALANGRVLEVGVGPGLNLPLYRDHGTEVIGLDPERKLLMMVSLKGASIPVRLIEASAELVPLKDSSVDSVVSSWTLCTIPDVVCCLREIRRVLQASGQFLFVEHGLAPDERVCRLQRRLTPIWKRLAGRCHLDRPISALIENAGFEIAHKSGYMPGPKLMTFMYEGEARPLS